MLLLNLENHQSHRLIFLISHPLMDEKFSHDYLKLPQFRNTKYKASPKYNNETMKCNKEH